MINKFSKALKEILSPCGINMFCRMRVLFLCRKSTIKKRAFLEFAILKTQGYTTASQEWNAIINEFKVYYSDGISELKYNIPNCTTIIGEGVFDYLNDTNVGVIEFLAVRNDMQTSGIGTLIYKKVYEIISEDAYKNGKQRD